MPRINTIFLGGDHAGFELKKILADMLRHEGWEVEDLGASVLNSADDYPDFIFPVATAVAADPLARGVIIGLSGQGEAMAANRVRGVRAAVYYGGPTDLLKLSRAHNDANILSLSARFLTDDEAKAAVTLWLASVFSGEERHVRRNAKLDQTLG